MNSEFHEKKILLPLNTLIYKSKLNLLDFHASALESCTIKNQILDGIKCYHQIILIMITILIH